VIRHDITRLKEAEESLREADHKKDEFIATLAHELRNPLAPIKNAVAILRQEPSDQGVRNRLRDMIGRQVDQMTRLIEDLLDVSRIASGKVMLKTEVLDARKVIDQALDTSRPLIDRKQHILEVNVTPQPLLVKADPVRLTQIVANVINNAAKYTDDGGHIWITAKSEGGQVVISIRDNGIGLAPEMQQRVFDLFTQVDQTISRSSGGLGIGLTLVRKLTEQHGGSVAVRSRGLGLGSEFIVSLEEFKAGAVEVKACPDGTDKLQDYPC
jgi:signal transduction histidine kinase